MEDQTSVRKEFERFDRPTALTPYLGFTQLARDRLAESREVILEKIVVGAGPHRFDRGLFADAARHDDERQSV